MFPISVPSKRLWPGETGPLARLLREARGLTLQQVADETQISVSGLSQAERNTPGGYRNAVRVIDHHLEALGRNSTQSPGLVRNEVRLYGDQAIRYLAKLRMPELARRAAMLKQALIARGLVVEWREANPVKARIIIGKESLQIALDDMVVYFSETEKATVLSHPGAKRLGRIVDIDSAPGDSSSEQWVQSIDRFARTMADAVTDGSVDVALLSKTLLPLVSRPNTLGTENSGE